MRKVPIDQVQPGMVLGRSILTLNNSVLVRDGVRLLPEIITSLRRKGVPALYVRDEDLDADVEVRDVVSESSRKRAVITVQGIVQALTEDVKRGRPVGRALQDPRIRQVTENLLDDVLRNREMAISLADIRSMDDFHFAHSVHVCILSMMTGVSLGYDPGRLRDLGMGALLHDIGNIRVRPEIINKRGPLSPEELEEQKKHAEYGFEILRRQPDLSLLAAHVAFQHHERHNGDGYPRGLRGDEIHEMARIVSVVDTFDALTADRPYRRAYLPHEAAEMLSVSGAYLFDHRIVAAFLENVAPYPVGSWVQLSDGSTGVVTRVTKRSTSRPTVRLIIDPQGGRYQPPRDINLADHPTIFVTRVFTGPSALTSASLNVGEPATPDVGILRTATWVDPHARPGGGSPPGPGQRAPTQKSPAAETAPARRPR